MDPRGKALKDNTFFARVITLRSIKVLLRSEEGIDVCKSRFQYDTPHTNSSRDAIDIEHVPCQVQCRLMYNFFSSFLNRSQDP